MKHGQASKPAGHGRPAVGLRADAERNRERILAAAHQLYAAQGLGVSMSAISRAAGVGKATLLRHFKAPDELIDEVFSDRMQAYATAAEEATADADGWNAFVEFVWRVCELQASDRAFADVLTLTFPNAAKLEAVRSASYHAFLEIIARAKATGHLRDDFKSEDLVLLMMANAGVVAATASDAPSSWRRHVAQALRGYASPGAPLPPLPPAPSSDDLYLAMARSAPSVLR